MTIKEAKKVLGKDGEKYTDKQLIKSLEISKFFADLCVDRFLTLSPKDKKKYRN
jgi:hypothetical protein